MSVNGNVQQARVGLLGIGLMGAAMGRRLLSQGISVTAWDRTPEKVDALVACGATGAERAADVLRSADLVITMLPTADVVLAVVEPLLKDWPEGVVWAQMSSIGMAEADQLTWIAKAHGITLVDAPVSGSTQPAEQGQLTVLASGPESARDVVKPVFDALASRVLWVGEAGMGSRLKLAANHWMITSVAALAESMRLSQEMGLDQEHFVELLNGGPLGSAYAAQKLAEMQRHEYPAGFPVRLALKDLQLVCEVADRLATKSPVLDAVLGLFLLADRDLADQDLAAVFEVPRAGQTDPATVS